MQTIEQLTAASNLSKEAKKSEAALKKQEKAVAKAEEALRKQQEKAAEKENKKLQREAKNNLNPLCDAGYTEEMIEPTQHINRGTGAGGANTNVNGIRFEDKTNNYARLLQTGFSENPRASTRSQWASKMSSDGTKYTYVTQYMLRQYINENYGIELFRNPDEAYIIEPASPTDKRIIKILEKKAQYVDGSVETKLWSGPSLKREYELVLGPQFEVHYCYCVSNFLKEKLVSGHIKYTTLNTILQESQIQVLFGDDADYFETLDRWIYN